MSASEKETAEPAPSEPSSSKKPLLFVGLVALAVGAGVGMFLLPRVLHGGAHAKAGDSAAAAEEQSAESEGAKPAGGEAKSGAAGGAFSDRIVQFEPFVVNVSGENYPRYLKLQVVFEMSSAATKAKLEEHMPQVRDLTISLLSSKRLADITDFEGKALLKDDLRTQVDELLGKDAVESVLFTEFVVQ